MRRLTIVQRAAQRVKLDEQHFSVNKQCIELDPDNIC
jgi:hypothetical protein